MMSKVWAVVFLSLLLIEPSASLAIQMDSGSSQDSSGSIPGSGGDKNGTEGGSSPSGDPKPMQIGAGVALGLLLSGGSGSSGTGKKMLRVCSTICLDPTMTPRLPRHTKPPRRPQRRPPRNIIKVSAIVVCSG